AHLIHLPPYPSPPPPPQLPAPLPAASYVEHQKETATSAPRSPACRPPQLPAPLPAATVTIRNDVNVKKETVRIEEDEENPGSFLVVLTIVSAIGRRNSIGMKA
ncbi:unnamed protein product, partial [Linum tenue]